VTEPERHLTLSAADEEFLREHAGVREPTEGELAELAERTAGLDAEERRFSLPLPKVAVWLGVTEAEVASMTAAGNLYAHTLAGETRWPAWQFAYGRPLPHLAAVVAAIPAGTHPTAIRTLMMTPSQDLMWVLPLDEPISPLIPEIPRSPATWLTDGGEAGPVLTLLAAAAGAI